MGDLRTSWAAVGDHLEALALKLELHVQEERSKAPEVHTSFERAGASLRAALDAVGAAVRDAAVEDDLRVAAEAFNDALHNTASVLARSLERTVARDQQ